MEFKDLNLNKPLLNALSDLELSQATDIQEQSFPIIMSGKDAVGIAQTGTGKTIAYLLPLLRLWKFTKDSHPRILILVPTRELTIQVKEEIDKLTTYMNVKALAIYGGVNIKRNAVELSEGCDVIVATPGRLVDLLLNKAFNPKHINKLVIDEVDQMLILGFRSQLNTIFDLIPEKRQNLLFSATSTEDVDTLISTFFNKPQRIVSAESGTPLDNITQAKYSLPNFFTKINLLMKLVNDKDAFKKVIVFVNTKKTADLLYNRILPLFAEGLGLIHNNKTQNFRLDAVKNFEEGKYQVLIATDILARGIDLTNVSHVINFEIPEEPEGYIHRIGRTGRAQQKGKTLSFVKREELERMQGIEELMDFNLPVISLPLNLELSEELLPEEIPSIKMPNMGLKNPLKSREVGDAFHEKSSKKINITADEARLRKRRARSIKMNKKKPKSRRNLGG
jgi:ATP-dependent RNA helicase RhlE